MRHSNAGHIKLCWSAGA